MCTFFLISPLFTFVLQTFIQSHMYSDINWYHPTEYNNRLEIRLKSSSQTIISLHTKVAGLVSHLMKKMSHQYDGDERNGNVNEWFTILICVCVDAMKECKGGTDNSKALNFKCFLLFLFGLIFRLSRFFFKSSQHYHYSDRI